MRVVDRGGAVLLVQARAAEAAVVTERQRRMSGGIVRFEAQCLLQQWNRNRSVLCKVRMRERLCTQNQVVSLKASGALPPHPIEFGAAQIWFDGTDDALRDLVLQRKDVVELPVKTLGPDQFSTFGIAQLRGNTDPLPRLADTPFEH